MKGQDSRGIRFERRPTRCQVRPMLRYLPAPLPRLQHRVLGRWLVDQIRHPRVPPWLNLCGVVFFLLVVDPSRSYWLLRSARVQLVTVGCWEKKEAEGGTDGVTLVPSSRSTCCRICRLRCRCQLWCRPCIASGGRILLCLSCGDSAGYA